MPAILSLNNKTCRFILFVAFIVLCLAAAVYFKVDSGALRVTLRQYPIIISGIIFILLYTAVTFFIWFGTIDFFRITAAVLFGGPVSSVLVWIAELINAFTLFHVSRKLGQQYVLEKFRLKGSDLKKVQGGSSVLSIFTLRVNPLVPFRLMDLAYGLTQVSFSKYFLGIVATSFLRILWLQYILAAIGESILKNPSAMPEYMQQYILSNQQFLAISGVYFFIVFVLSIVAVIARKVVKRKLREGAPSVKSKTISDIMAPQPRRCRS